MNFSLQHIELKNSSALLVPLNKTLHSAAFYNYALTEPSTWQYSMVSPGGSTTAMEEYIDTALLQNEQNTGYTFTVLHVPSNEIAGCTRFYDIDFTNKIATIGYTWYGEKYRRTGLNRHCKLLMLSHAFETWKLERVEFRADINNKKSVNAMLQIGCQQEGILRSHSALANGERRTSVILSILKHEWENGVKENLLKKIYV